MASIRTMGAVVALMGTLLWIGTAFAADQGITGKKLLLKSPGKFVLLSFGSTSSGGQPSSSAWSSTARPARCGISGLMRSTQR